MCNNNTRTILQEHSKSLTGWDRAIYDAEQKIQATKGRLTLLKASLSLFKEKKESGEPFPGESPKQNEAQT